MNSTTIKEIEKLKSSLASELDVKIKELAELIVAAKSVNIPIPLMTFVTPTKAPASKGLVRGELQEKLFEYLSTNPDERRSRKHFISDFCVTTGTLINTLEQCIERLLKTDNIVNGFKIKAIRHEDDNNRRSFIKIAVK